MSIPPFILELRAAIGTKPLWLSGVTAVVVRDTRILLVKRSDTLEWTPVTGIVDPGEQPAIAARREVLEEAGVDAIVVRLASVDVSAPRVYSNGDQAQYLDITFLCRWVAGEPYPADGENVEAVWFERDALPPMEPEFVRRIEDALSDEIAARFLPVE